MNIFSFISKHKYFSQIYPITIDVVSITTKNTTSSWMIPCIDLGLILFSATPHPWGGWTCVSHSSGMATAQKILRARYLWPSVFKDCHEAPPCQHFYPKKCSHPAPLHPVITVGPFAKWGIDYIHCNPTSTGGHGYIIIAIDYFTKWDNSMPTYAEYGKCQARFSQWKLYAILSTS